MQGLEFFKWIDLPTPRKLFHYYTRAWAFSADVNHYSCKYFSKAVCGAILFHLDCNPTRRAAVKGVIHQRQISHLKIRMQISEDMLMESKLWKLERVGEWAGKELRWATDNLIDIMEFQS